MKDDVKRWNLDIPEAGMLREPDGEYILAADYDRLLAERDALAASHARLVEGGRKVVDTDAKHGPCFIEIDGMVGALSLARDLPADGVREAAQKIRDLVMTVENRAMAADGPVVSTFSEMSKTETAQLERLLGELIAALEPRP